MSNRRKTNNFAKPDPIPYVRGLAVLMPEELIECALIRYGRKERRRRKLPARCVVWVVVLMSLLADESIPQVFRALHPSRDSPDPTESAFTKARHRLGVSVMRKLFYSISCQLAPLDLPGVCYRRWRLMGIDGSEIDMPDTPENVAIFGRHDNQRAPAAYPQLRVLALCELGPTRSTTSPSAPSGSASRPWSTSCYVA